MIAMEASEIKLIRKRLGITCDELGERIGVNGQTVRRWECGLREARGPAVAMLRVIAKEKGGKKAKRKTASA